LKYLESQGSRAIPGIVKERAKAIWELPEDARIRAVEDLATLDPKVGRAVERWRARFDHQWLRSAVELFAKGQAKEALMLMQEHECLHLISGRAQAQEELIAAWSAHKAPLHDKAIIAATRADVASLNQLARSALVAAGVVADIQGIEVAITLKDESQEQRRFAPGDRIVFTKNDRDHDTTNGLLGTISAIERRPDGLHLVVELDDASKGGKHLISVPASFGHFDLAYCLTNHKAQGKTVDTAFVFVDPRHSGREWSYVAASRSKHGTHLFVDEAPLHPLNPDAHHEAKGPMQSPLELLAARMSRSQAKGTTLDYAAPDINPSQGLLDRLSRAAHDAMQKAVEFAARKAMPPEPQQEHEPQR
jgi:hypothetical protein